MPALEAGVRAPEINLNTLDGRKFSLQQALKRGPLVAAFFKVDCPVCQFTFPYLERIFKAYEGNGRFSVVGISQNNAAETEAFNRQYGISFPTLLDEKGKYPASNAFGLTNVPTIFLISQEGDIESSFVGWSKADMEALSRKLAALSDAKPAQLFKPSEQVPAYKPG